ncbi:MAG: UvrD-helicase domain-containing protein [Desulfitobacterium hafniense]|nr:UvrD-helicase domain-containing protein [Desulfitobacterium hafniense]
MTDTRWTPEQQAAIDLRGQLLVAAAAGSGKTAVLVERLIKRITSPEEIIDVDKFLVVTFTKAAASEMRERVGKSLDDALFKEPEPKEVERLIRQRSLLNKASITTLHSFCMELIRKYFYLLELDPAFRVADEAEAEILRQDIVQDLFESFYEQEDKDFEALVDAFGSDRDDAPLMGLVLSLYEFAFSQVDPDRWLTGLSQPYQFLNTEEMTQSPWGLAVRQGVLDCLSQCRLLLERAYRIATGDLGPLQYAEVLQADLNRVDLFEQVLFSGTWEEAELIFEEVINFPRLASAKSKKGKGYSGDEQADDELEQTLKAEAKNLRDKAKTKLTKLKDELFVYSVREQISALNKMGRLVQKLGFITKEFALNYLKAKHARNIVDFTDLEHFALHLLQGKEGPSDIAINLQEHFVEVLVDEYQDINPVQERILQLVSKVDSEEPNLFMVGDVKQSIYRFRMADPTLFLRKYLEFPHLKFNSDQYSNRTQREDSHKSLNLVIDLNRNFRSRIEVVQGVNFLFRQIMSRGAGEIPYDDNAALQYGANYVTSQSDLQTAEGPIEVHLFDPDLLRSTLSPKLNHDLDQNHKLENNILNDNLQVDTSAEQDQSLEELETARIEARFVSQRIRKMVEGSEFQIYDKKLNTFRPVRYSDIVILMRSYSAVAPIYVEEFQSSNIPVFAETNTGYFGNSEVETILSLLKVIDNPRQDIPLAAVLRSPIVGLNGGELGKIRAILKHGDFYESLAFAVWAGLESIENCREQYLKELKNTLRTYLSSWSTLLRQAKDTLSQAPELKDKIVSFWLRLQTWRQFARRNSLVDLIALLYDETGYLAFVGTLPGGIQRQANLRVLYDRALKFETTHFRGLFRFLKFLERFQGQGKDMGTARTLGETEDVVRLITVHSSKGLEFPVVFVVGLGTKFNTSSLKGKLLLHSSLGAGVPILDIENRVKYPSIIQYALKQRLWQESLAEEMRILYVALTRAKEKLLLYGGVKNLFNAIQEWVALSEWHDITFPDGQLRSAKSFLDWIGPALARHPANFFSGETQANLQIPEVHSNWEVLIHTDWSTHGQQITHHQSDIEQLSTTYSNTDLTNSRQENTIEMDLCRANAQVVNKVDQAKIGTTNLEPEKLFLEIDRRLSWKYPYLEEVKQVAKTSVSELKRLYIWYSDHDSAPSEKLIYSQNIIIKRPQFIQNHKHLTAAERGTALHTAMQHLPFDDLSSSWLELDQEQKQVIIETYLTTLKVREILRSEQVETVSSEVIVNLLDSPLGSRLLSAEEVLREVPFTMMFTPPGYNYPMLVQGVIDALILDKTNQTVELLDYKTDAFGSEDLNPEYTLIDRYSLQLALYTQAVERLLDLKVIRSTIYSSFLGKEIDLDIEIISRLLNNVKS